MNGKQGLGSNGSLTIVDVNPVKGGTTATVTHTRARSNGDVTRCSLEFLGPLSRKLLRRMNQGFHRVIAVRSKIVRKKVKDTMLRFVTSRRCAPAIGHVKVPSGFIRRNAVTRLCRLYKVSRSDVAGRLLGRYTLRLDVDKIGRLAG